MTMTKRDLVTMVANKLGMTQCDASRIIKGVFETITKSPAEGRRWELRDFGIFEVKNRAPRIGRNPRTGEQVPCTLFLRCGASWPTLRTGQLAA